jgi:hypothetical protein
MPAVPLPIAGLSKSSSSDAIAGTCSRAAFDRVGCAGSLGFLGGDFAIPANMGGVSRREKSRPAKMRQPRDVATIVIFQLPAAARRPLIASNVVTLALMAIILGLKLRCR